MLFIRSGFDEIGIICIISARNTGFICCNSSKTCFEFMSEGSNNILERL